MRIASRHRAQTPDRSLTPEIASLQVKPLCRRNHAAAVAIERTPTGAALECGQIPAFRNVGDDLVIVAGPKIIFREPESQPSGFHPDDWINLWLEGRIAVEDIDRDLSLLQRLVRFRNRMLHYVPQETLEPW